MPEKKPKINVVSADDWYGLYIDGKLVTENHSLRWSDVLQALGIKYNWDAVDEEWMEEHGRLPENFKDVKLSDD
jgi:hypothetical protein